jgi:hypothetical protein
VAYSDAGGDTSGWAYQTSGDVYPGGAQFISNETVPPSDGWNENAAYDFAFRTYVVPTPPSVPKTPTKKKKCKRKKKHKSGALIAKKCRKKHH